MIRSGEANPTHESGFGLVEESICCGLLNCEGINSYEMDYSSPILTLDYVEPI